MPNEPLFRIGPYWGGFVTGSKNIYCFRYDAGSGEVRRRSLKTTDVKEAERQTAAIWLAETQTKARAPEDVMLITVLEKYWTEHSDRRANPSAARRAGSLLLDFLGDDSAKVSSLTRATQRSFIAYLHERHGLAVATISRNQSVIAAALKHARREDEDGILPSVPYIIVPTAQIADILDEPEPKPDNWHPTLEQIAMFCDAAHTEAVLRMVVLTLAFAARPVAVQEATGDQFDARHGLMHWNPDGRRQTKKHRPTLPVPPRLLPHLARWSFEGGRIIGGPIRKPWHATRESVGLPEKFRPKSLRHFMATEMRCQHVEQEQRESWMGHRRLSTNDHYGSFTPDFLYRARDCAEALLSKLEPLCQLSIYRQFPAKSKPKPYEPILRRIDPTEKIGAGEGIRTPDPNLGKVWQKPKIA